MSQTEELIKAVSEFLKESHYQYVWREKTVVELTFFFPVKVLGKTISMKEFVFIGDRDIRVIGVMPFSVPADKRDLAAEYLMRVNYWLQTGWFSMCYDDGEVRASAERSQFIGVPSAKDLNQLIMTPVTIISNFAGGLILTIRDYATPKENAEKYTPDVMKE